MKKTISYIIIGLLILSWPIGPLPFEVLAQTPEFRKEEIVRAEAPIELVVGEIRSVAVYAPTRISLADPKIADLVKVEGEEAILAGKGPGSTTLNIWDKYGWRSIVVRVVSEDLESVKTRVEQLLEHAKIKDLAVEINREEGRIMVTGKALTPEKKKIEDLLDPFKGQIINLVEISDDNSLVQIDVQILELSKSVTDQLGIAWVSALQVREEPYTSGSTTTGGTTTTLNKIDTFAKIWRIVDWSRDALTAKLNMLISEGKGRVLSRPKLVCMSGKEAEFLVGGQVPIITTTTTTGGTVQTNVEFRPYGVNLKIKPVVREDNKIDTTIDTEVSSIDSGNSVTVSGYTVPAFATRSASTQLYLKDGQTIFIAGLIKNEESNALQRLPAISKIPILGELFKSKTFRDSETELVVSLTPTIIALAREKEVQPTGAAAKPAKVATEEKETITTELAPQVILREMPDYLAGYTRQIQQKIARAVVYPEEASQLGWEGAVRLDLKILSDGTLSSIRVKQSSGYEIFDDSAVNAAKNSAPFPIFPAELRAREINIDVPVIYNLSTNS
ncbi:MAG: TonB family protein [Candidatus Omnitrophota bacterium]